ncbi:hypothetical protein K4F52_000182 [Lecanicillium sp. MT-2017a]|nr:hypothetical protein K4F52_000182 [Lecanicillium sp. MT-2017a]
MGVVFPHVQDANDAKAAVAISKYPSKQDTFGGCRSMTGQLPAFSLQPTKLSDVIEQSNSQASSVLLMIETKGSVEKIDEIAAVHGVDVLLVGTNDLSIELGSPGDFRSPVFRAALENISRACKKYGRVMGVAGIYGDRDFHDWAIHVLGVGFMLGQQDSGILLTGAVKCAAEIEDAESHSTVTNGH